MFHAIGKAVNAPSRVLLARSRSRQEDAEGFRQCSAWFWADYIFLLLVTAGPNMDADRCVADMPRGSELARQRQTKSKASARGQLGRHSGMDKGPEFEPSLRIREPDESFNGRCTQPMTLRNTSHANGTINATSRSALSVCTNAQRLLVVIPCRGSLRVDGRLCSSIRTLS